MVGGLRRFVAQIAATKVDPNCITKARILGQGMELTLVEQSP
jgi:hypothetical protein